MVVVVAVVRTHGYVRGWGNSRSGQVLIFGLLRLSDGAGVVSLFARFLLLPVYHINDGLGRVIPPVILQVETL